MIYTIVVDTTMMIVAAPSVLSTPVREKHASEVKKKTSLSNPTCSIPAFTVGMRSNSYGRTTPRLSMYDMSTHTPRTSASNPACGATSKIRRGVRY